MNGGVSLAVWMGGVACELDNARRASNGIDPPADAKPAQIALHRAWKEITERTKVKVTVDVIAGTSAGGLNGVLLAAAIARGAPLDGLKQLWLDSGQASAEALFQPQDHGALSLMNGDFFHGKIAQALDQMIEKDGDGRDISLIVTSTALGDSSRTVRDSTGQTFSEADHRRRFQFFRHAALPEYKKDGDHYVMGAGKAVDHLSMSEPLATAGRASASYPGAFAPVEETPQLRHRRVWPDQRFGSTAEWLADGGILDNSPFEPVLDAVQATPVTGPWKRWVCFVVPSGDEGALGQGIQHPRALGGASTPPPPWTEVVGAAFSFPREADFRDDIDQLHSTIRNGRTSFDVRRFTLLTTNQPDLDKARAICTAALPLYRQSSAAAAVYQVWDIIAARRATGYIDPVQAVDDAHFDPGDHPWLPGTFPAADSPLPAEWHWSVDAADRVVRTMLRTSADADAPTELREKLSSALAQIAAVGDALNKYLETAAGKDDQLAEDRVRGLLDSAYTELGIGEELAPIVNAAAELYAAQHPRNTVSAADVLAAALAVEVSNGAGSLPSDAPRPIFDFIRIGLDKPPGELREAYHTALHPAAGTGQQPSPDTVLYGSRLFHFAAFGNPDWRSWDWLWGRMNALAHLQKILGLEDEDVKRLITAILEAEGFTLEKVKQRIGEVVAKTPHELLDEMRADGQVFPAGADALLEWLRSPISGKPGPPLSHLTEAGQIMSDILARAGQTGDVKHHALRAAGLPVRDLMWERVYPAK